MCSTCGCSQPAEAVSIQLVGADKKEAILKASARARQGHHHHHHHGDHSHDQQQADHSHLPGGHHHHHHHHGHEQAVQATGELLLQVAGEDANVIRLEQQILGENNRLAERNRGYFEAKNMVALNLVSSPGSGKTSLLERTLRELGTDIPCSVIEGDQQTTNDADRIAATGVPVVQINTGKGCHLDAEMINRALKALRPADESLLFIENVGNLVCPALFDLGESVRATIISVTEGDDKPLKYPDIFHSAQLVIVNKIDLLPYVPFNLDTLRENIARVSHHPDIICLSAYTGQGMEDWYQWLRRFFSSRQS
jgi:hydrogenase nickel incorporation protein HypB